MLYGGLLLNNQTTTSGMVVMQYYSFFHYGYEALMANEFAPKMRGGMTRIGIISHKSLEIKYGNVL